MALVIDPVVPLFGFMVLNKLHNPRSSPTPRPFSPSKI